MKDADAIKRRELLKQLKNAEAACKAASREFSACLRDVPSSTPQPDGVARVQKAGRAYLWAIAQHRQALERFTDAAVEDEEPVQ